MDFVSKKYSFEPGDRCIVIGEIGVNHNGREDLLFTLIDAGIDAGIDIVKLQRFNSEEEIAESAPITEYQKKSGVQVSQLEMAKKLELSDELLGKAYEYCKQKGIGFLCTAFDHSSVDFIADRLGCRSVKVPSPDITNRPLLEHMARKFDAMLVSTGASYLSECSVMLDWIRTTRPVELALMHCVSEYPAPLSEINLKVMQTLSSAFHLPVGFSDHTEGIVAGIVSASLGAAMIEKHYTLDKAMEGPDHAASASLDELKALVDGVRGAWLSLGNGIKEPAASERNNRSLIRKCLTCAVPVLPKGAVLSREMFGIKRPFVEGSVEPQDIEKIVGLQLHTEKRFDQAILWSDFRKV